MLQINFTQLTGLIGFGAPVVLCLWAGWHQKNARHIWWVLSIVYLAMFADIQNQLRFEIRYELINTLKLFGVYESRQIAQMVFVILVVGVAAILGLLVFTSRRSLATTARLAVFAAVLALTLTGLEVISLHTFDIFFYTPIGPVLVIGWLWLACGLTSAVAAAMAVRASVEDYSPLRIRRSKTQASM